MPSDAVTAPDYFDDSSKVPCSEPHTTETVKVLRLSEPTIAEAKEQKERAGIPSLSTSGWT